MAQTGTAERPLRKDAERNRRRILEAARTVFGERGLGVTLDDIAREAGVGVGTVYRRFPDKDALIDAVLEDRVEAVAQLAREGLEIEDPWDGLVHFMTGAVERQRLDRGLRELLFSVRPRCDKVSLARERIVPLAERLLSRAQEAGVVRADLAATDLPLLQVTVVAAIEFARAADSDVWRRAQTVLFDGLRPARDDTTPLDRPPLTQEQLTLAMTGGR